MPITMPSVFAQNHLRVGALTSMVAIFLNNTGSNVTHIASTIDLSLGGSHIHAHLLSVSSINEKLDLPRKTWGTSDITIQLLNPRYTPGAAGIKDRLSEATDPDWGSTILDWAFVWIYCIAGSNVASITADGILRFSGRILGIPTVTEKTITVKAISREKEQHVMLPTDLIGDTYPNAPSGNLEQYKPIVYGTFNQNFWGDVSHDGDPFTEGFGLAKALRVDEEEEPEFVVSDHILNVAPSPLFFGVETRLPAQALNSTGDDDDSGDGTVVWNFSDITKQFHLSDNKRHLIQRFVLIAPGGTHFQPTNPDNIHDNNFVTYSTFVRSTGIPNPKGEYGLLNSPLALEALTANAKYSAQTRLRYYNVTDASVGSAITFSGYMLLSPLQSWINPGIDGGPSGNNYIQDETDFGNASWASIGIGPITDIDLDVAFLFGILNVQIVVGVRFSANPDPTPDEDLANVREMMFEVVFQLDAPPLFGWAQCKGREYGSWITASGRSIDSKASGDLIENQAHIIESILRDCMGVTTINIDTDSFDDAYEISTAEANRQARLNLITRESSEVIIRKLVEQSTFAFTWTAAGKAKLVPLHSSYWSSKPVDATIPWSHIKPGSLKLSKTRVFCNELTVQSRWQGESGQYRDTDTTTDSGSQTSYGIWRRNARWQNIVGATRDHVADGYVFSVGGLWSQPHLHIDFETLAFTNAQLEIGDALQLDSVSCDPHLKAYGESWSGPKFCVIELQQKMDGTRIKAVELF